MNRLPRRMFFQGLAGIGFLRAGYRAFAAATTARTSAGTNWYLSSFYLLHEDHHTQGTQEVGRDADPGETQRLVNLSRPDVIQIHAKGNPGWTTYPSRIGHTPPKLKRDVLAVWRDIARRNNYHFSAYYNIGRDGEIMQRRPEWNRVRADGTLADRALCYHSGVAENYLWPMIDEIIEAYQPDGFWFDGSCFTVALCYCPKCLERFERENGFPAPRKAGLKGWAEFKEMQRQVYREFVSQTIARIKKKSPQCLVAVNWAYSLMMPEDPDPALDYLTGDHGNDVDALSREAHWYDSLGKPYDLMTTIFYRDGGVSHPKPSEQIEQEMAIIIANGGRYFAWDHPTPTSGLAAERHEFLGKVVAPFLRARQRWCLGTERVPEVSLLNAAASHYAVTASSERCFVRPNPAIFGATDALTRLHIDYEMISDERLERGDVRSPLLVAENPIQLTAANIAALRRYVGNGGKLLMTGGSVAALKLESVFGLEKIGVASDFEAWTVADGGEPIQFHAQVHRVVPAGAKVLLNGRDATGASFPLLTAFAVGKGMAFYVPVAMLSTSKGVKIPDALLEQVFEILLPRADRCIAINAPPTVEITLRRKDSSWILHQINRAPGTRKSFPSKPVSHWCITDIPPAPPCRLSLRLPAKPRSVQLQPGGVAFKQWVYRKGRIECDLPAFRIHQMLAMQL